jgi:hypothetical protein
MIEKLKSEELICEICEEFIKLPEKLVIVKKIVSETEYNKEAMTSFAEHLALFDKKFDFFEIIPYIAENKLNNNFLQGFYSGVYKIYNVLPDKLINVLDQIAVINPDFVLWASVVCDVSDSGYKRIISLLYISDSLYYVENNELEKALSYFDWAAEGRTELDLLPEQIHKDTGKPVWIVPLTWSHAMYALVYHALQEKKLI